MSKAIGGSANSQTPTPSSVDLQARSNSFKALTDLIDNPSLTSHFFEKKSPKTELAKNNFTLKCCVLCEYSMLQTATLLSQDFPFCSLERKNLL